MATYASLSQGDKDALQSFVNDVRLEVAKIFNAAKNAELFVSVWNDDMSALVSTLGAGEVIPNTTGLDGARGITKENLANNLMAYITTTSSMGTTGHLDNIIPAAGLRNVQV